MSKEIGSIFRVNDKVLMVVPDEYRAVGNATEADYIDIAEWWEANGLSPLGNSPSSRTVAIVEDEELGEYRFELPALSGCGLEFPGVLGGKPYFKDYNRMDVLWTGGCIPAGVDVLSE